MKLVFMRRNLGYKIFSLIAALMLYYVAVAQQNPMITRDQYVQPEIAKLPNNQVVKDAPQLIPISITGTAEALQQLEKQPVKASVDATVAKPGLNSLPIALSLPSGVSLNTNSSLPLARFTTEKKEQRDYSVDVDFAGTPPAGQVYGDGVATPRTVTVQGLAEDLKKVGRVVASVERERDELTVERKVTLYAEDDQRRRVDGVEILPNQVSVQVKLRPVPTTKTMILSVLVDGKPAPGYRFVNYEVTPPQIVVRGSVEALSSRSSLPVRVDISGLSAPTTQTATLTLPPGMSPQEALPPIKVRVFIEPIDRVNGSAESRPSPAPAPSAVPSPNASP